MLSTGLCCEALSQSEARWCGHLQCQMLNIRLFLIIIVCLLNSHLRKDANIYNNIVLTTRWSAGIHFKNHFHSNSNSRYIRAIPLPLGGKYKTLPYTNPATEIRGKTNLFYSSHGLTRIVLDSDFSGCLDSDSCGNPAWNVPNPVVCDLT